METKQQTLTNEFEKLFAVYVSKLARVDELKQQGRYGYQLRMPKMAVRKAYHALVEFGERHNVSMDGIL